MIRWEQQDNGDWAGFSGELLVASVSKDRDAERERWLWNIAGLKRAHPRSTAPPIEPPSDRFAHRRPRSGASTWRPFSGWARRSSVSLRLLQPRSGDLKFADSALVDIGVLAQVQPAEVKPLLSPPQRNGVSKWQCHPQHPRDKGCVDP